MVKKKEKPFSLKKQYRKSWDYIKESKNFIYIIVGFFLIFALIGFFVPAPEALSEQIMKLIQQLLEQTKGMSNGELIKFIFFNNLKSSFFGFLFGLVLGIFPVIGAITNGYLLGFVATMATQTESIWVLARILPHGIFELPAVFISFGLGLRFGMFIFKKNKIKTLKETFWNSLRVFLLVVLPLLIIAAIIEATLISISG